MPACWQSGNLAILLKYAQMTRKFLFQYSHFGKLSAGKNLEVRKEQGGLAEIALREGSKSF